MYLDDAMDEGRQSKLVELTLFMQWSEVEELSSIEHVVTLVVEPKANLTKIGKSCSSLVIFMFVCVCR